MKKTLTKNEQMDVMYDGFLKMQQLASYGIEKSEELIAEVNRLEESNEELMDFIQANGLTFEKKYLN
jgi:hypothetical protein